MSDDHHASDLPHFLRVARSVASARGVRSIALPLAATAAIGIGCGSGSSDRNVYCGQVVGVLPAGVHCVPTAASSSGQGGAPSASSSSGSGMGGYGGEFMGLIGDAGEDAPTMGTGVMVMPDAGSDASK